MAGDFGGLVDERCECAFQLACVGGTEVDLVEGAVEAELDRSIGVAAVDVIDPGANPGKKAGFQARPAVGGVLVKMLAGPAFRAKWSAAAGTRPAE